MRGVIVGYCNERLVQVCVAAISNNRVEIRLVAIVVAATDIVIVAQTGNRLSLVLVVRRVVVPVAMVVRIEVGTVGQVDAGEANEAKGSAAKNKRCNTARTGATRFVGLLCTAAVV